MGALRRAIDRFFDRLSIRPLSILVFIASAGLLVYLQTSSFGHFRARAIARAPSVEHPALVESFVSAVYVLPGDSVDVGAPLADLSPYFIERELSRLNAKSEQLIHERNLERARLLVKEERWVSPELRLRPNRPSIDGETEALYTAELEVLQMRRSQLEETLDHLTVTSQITGRVALIATKGSSVAFGTSIAAITPEYANEIVAYVPPDTDPARIGVGIPVRIARHFATCAGMGSVLRRGAAVEQMPSQIDNFFGISAHGMPVYISVPPDCQLGIGQVLSVDFAKASM
jgi:multidrug efflux pump subunit AcrA (membrane-fusion protein)